MIILGIASFYLTLVVLVGRTSFFWGFQQEISDKWIYSFENEISVKPIYVYSGQRKKTN